MTEVALEMVSANMGVMCMPNWSLKPFNLNKELVFKRLGKQGLKRKHYLTFHKDNAAKKYYRDFIGNLEEEFGALESNWKELKSLDNFPLSSG